MTSTIADLAGAFARNFAVMLAASAIGAGVITFVLWSSHKIAEGLSSTRVPTALHVPIVVAYLLALICLVAALFMTLLTVRHV